MDIEHCEYDVKTAEAKTFQKITIISLLNTYIRKNTTIIFDMMQYKLNSSRNLIIFARALPQGQKYRIL